MIKICAVLGVNCSVVATLFVYKKENMAAPHCTSAAFLQLRHQASAPGDAWRIWNRLFLRPNMQYHHIPPPEKGGRKPALSRNRFCSASCLAPNPNGRCSPLSFGSFFFPISLPYVPFLHVMPFSRMRSKGSRFTLGVWGLRVCSLDVAVTFATF